VRPSATAKNASPGKPTSSGGRSEPLHVHPAPRALTFAGTATCRPGERRPACRPRPAKPTCTTLSDRLIRAPHDCRGTSRGTSAAGSRCTGCVPGVRAAASVQAVRPGRPDGPLLIRGFGVQVPGGAPVLTWPFSAREWFRRPWRGTSRSAASLHIVHSMHMQLARLITLGSQHSLVHAFSKLRPALVRRGDELDENGGALDGVRAGLAD